MLCKVVTAIVTLPAFSGQLPTTSFGIRESPLGTRGNVIIALINIVIARAIHLSVESGREARDYEMAAAARALVRQQVECDAGGM